MIVGNTTWRILLTEAFEKNGESWADIEANTMTEAEMDQEFDDGFGSPEGCEFTIWTPRFVYFPSNYDGAEAVESVSRHPDGIPTAHVGGG